MLVSDPDGKNMRIFASGLRNAVFRGYQVAFVPFRDGRPSGEATPFFSDLYRAHWGRQLMDASCTVTFTPPSANSFSGIVAVTSNALNSSLSMALSGSAVTPATLTGTPSTLTFTNVVVGQNQSQTQTAMNSGGVNATISSATVSGTGFSISGISAPLTLTPGQSASFSITFTPPLANNFSGSVAITSNASNPNLTLALSRTGTAAAAGSLSVSPTTVAVGNVVVGTSGTASATLTASGASVTVSSVTLGGTNPSEFSISRVTFPVTVTTNQPVAFTVIFTPGATGAASAAASFASNASSAPTWATLTGTGKPAAVYTVGLN